MNHYEIMLMIHPDQSEQAPAMVERYLKTIADDGGIVHRHEDWGRRPLAYSINKLHKAHYVLLNLEISNDTLTKLKDTFRYNDAILRDMVIRCDEAVTAPSPMMQPGNKEAAA